MTWSEELACRPPPVIARLTNPAEAISEMDKRLPRGVYPERWADSSPLAQNGKRRRARNEIRGKAWSDKCIDESLATKYARI